MINNEITTTNGLERIEVWLILHPNVEEIIIGK